MDICTGTERKLINPRPTDNTITTTIRYDMGASCASEGDRVVMVTGTVTDRFGASAPLCDRDSQCPLVAFSQFQEIDPDAIVNGDCE